MISINIRYYPPSHEVFENAIMICKDEITRACVLKSLYFTTIERYDGHTATVAFGDCRANARRTSLSVQWINEVLYSIV